MKIQKSIIIVTFAAAIFRLVNLGYSDFLQDEVGAQNYLFGEQNPIEFLFSRSIGPGEFVISYIFNFFFYNRNPEFFVRLPFTIFGILIIPLVYFVVARFLNKKTALITSALFAFSGLFVAFSKIVQYQSVLIFLIILSLYFLSSHNIKLNYKFLAVSGILAGISVLFHYDALSYILPAFVFLTLKKDVKGILYFGVPTTFIIGLFYIPYILAPFFPQTLDYLLNYRIDSEFKFDSVYHSFRLLFFYHSKEFIFLLLFGLFGALFVSVKKFKNFSAFLLVLSLSFIIIRVFTPQHEPFLRYSSTFVFGIFCLSHIFNIYKKGNLNFLSFIEIWFLFAFITYGIFFTKPLTHIYSFLIPGFILSAHYFSFLLEKHKYAVLTVFFIAFVSAVSYNHQAFIETKTRFPWVNERYILGFMIPQGENMVNIAESLGIGFGFPYNRGWRQIQNTTLEFKNKMNIVSYNTNERSRIAKYYMQHLKNEPANPDIYIYVVDPYSLDNSKPENAGVLLQKNDYIIYDLSK